MKRIISRNPLFFAFFFPALTDGAVTLLGQDESYWASRVVNEASPAYYFLLTSPWLFAIGSILWFVFWYWISKRLKEPINLFVMFLFIAGHTWGSSSWIWRIMKTNGIYAAENQRSVLFAWSINVFYFALIAFFATYCLRVYLKR
jgi:hypothetical protein